MPSSLVEEPEPLKMLRMISVKDLYLPLPVPSTPSLPSFFQDVYKRQALPPCGGFFLSRGIVTRQKIQYTGKMCIRDRCCTTTGTTSASRWAGTASSSAAWSGPKTRSSWAVSYTHLNGLFQRNVAQDGQQRMLGNQIVSVHTKDSFRQTMKPVVSADQR